MRINAQIFSLGNSFVSFFIIGCLTFSSCKKKDVIDNQIQDNALTGKVLAFLQTQKLRGTTNVVNRNANIDLLTKYLDFTSARTEELDKKTDLLILDIKDDLITEKKLDKNSTLTLLLITDKMGKINSGSIVYFQPTDGKKHYSLPENTFSSMFNRKKVGLDGTYKFLTPTGRWLSQFQIRNAKVFSTGVVQQKDKLNSIARQNELCIDWYLITTYYYDDGTTSQTEEYLGRTCSETSCDNPDYAGLCRQGEDGGGSAGSNDIEQIVSGDATATLMESDSYPSSSPNLITVVYNGYISWQYNKSTQLFVFINMGNPFPIPVSQPFTDDNGNPAVLYNGSAYVNKYQTPISVKSVLCEWIFVETWDYVYTTGPLSIPRNGLLGRLIVAP